MQTLSLVLKKKWYDMIASGEKTEEYREIKPYWIVRMMEEVDMDFHAYEKVCHDTALFYEYNEHLLKNALYHGSMKFRDFDKVTFHLGYAKNRPSMTFAIKEIVIDEGKEEWGAFPGKTYFVVRLEKNCHDYSRIYETCRQWHTKQGFSLLSPLLHQYVVPALHLQRSRLFAS